LLKYIDFYKTWKFQISCEYVLIFFYCQGFFFWIW
jgi:hypothetical protein